MHYDTLESLKEQGSFNLVAYKQEWITVMIPSKEYNQMLKGDAYLGKHSYYWTATTTVL